MTPAKPLRTILLAAALATALATAALSPVVAQDTDDTREEIEVEDDDRRIRLRIEDDRARIDIQQRNRTPDDHARLQFDSDDAELRVSFETQQEGQEAERQLEATFHRLVEYDDADDDGTFEEGETVVSSWLLAPDADAEVGGGPVNGTLVWDRLEIQEATSDDDVPGVRIQGRADMGPDGTFGLDLEAYGKPAEAGGTQLEDAEAKIDILVDGYPYAAEETDLALVATVKAETELERGGQAVSDSGEDGLSAREILGDRVVEMTFTWKDNAQVDGSSSSVGSTVFSSEEEMAAEDGETATEHEKVIALAYSRGDRIVHDPVAGVATFEESSFPGGNDIPSAGLLAAAAVVAAAAARRRAR